MFQISDEPYLGLSDEYKYSVSVHLLFDSDQTNGGGLSIEWWVFNCWTVPNSDASVLNLASAVGTITADELMVWPDK